MEKRAVAVITAASLLGLAAALLGFTSEYFKHKAFVGSDISRCEYRRTPAFGCGIVAAVLSVVAVALVTGASGCFGRCGAVATESGRGCVWRVLAALAWFMVASATVMFMYGASWNAGGTRGLTSVSRPPGRNGDGRAYDFGCPELRNGVFVAASIKAIIAIVCAITAYADILKRRGRTPTLGVEMEQPYPAPVAYPAAPPPPYGGYGNGKY